MEEIKIKNIFNLLVFSLFFSFLLFSQQEEKTEVDKFLENIRQILKTIKNEKMKTTSRNKNSIRDAQYVSRKRRIKRQLLNKLTLPYVFQQKHHLINVKCQKPNAKCQSQKSDSKNEKKLSGPIIQSPSYNNIKHSSVYKNSSLLMPFKPPDIKSIISKLKNQQSRTFQGEDNLKTPHQKWLELEPFMNEIREWYYELAEKALVLWTSIEKFLVDTPNNYSSLKSNSNEKCPWKDEKEIFDKGYRDVAFLPSRFLRVFNYEHLYIHKYIRFLTPLTNQIGINPSYFNELLMGKQKITNSSHLCEDIIVLHSKGFFLKVEYLYKLTDCLNDYFVRKDTSENNYCHFYTGFKFLEGLLREIYENAKKWFKLFKLVIKKKVIPHMIEKMIDSLLDDSSPNVISVDDIVLNVWIYQVIIRKRLDELQQLYRIVEKIKSSGDTTIFSKIRELLKNNGCTLDFESVKNELETYIKSKGGDTQLLIANRFSEQFDNLLQFKYEIYEKVIKSSIFAIFINQIDKLKKMVRERKDRCALIMLSTIAPTVADAANFLSVNNLDGLIWYIENFYPPQCVHYSESECKTIKGCFWNTQQILPECSDYFDLCRSFTKEKCENTSECVWIENFGVKYCNPKDVFTKKIAQYINEEDNQVYKIHNTLNKLLLLNYDIYSKLRIYKLEKCVGVKIGLEEVEKAIKKYECIFNNASEISCLFDKNPAVKEIIDKLNGIKLNEINKKLREIDGKNLSEFSETVKNMCYSGIEKCISFYLDTGYYEEGSINYIDLNLFCERSGPQNQTGLQNLEKYCPDILDDCENVSESSLPQLCIVSPRSEAKGVQTANFGIYFNTVCKDECWKLYWWLQPIWQTNVCKCHIPTNQQLRQSFCRIMKENIKNCCDSINHLEGDNFRIKLSNFIKLQEYSCSRYGLREVFKINNAVGELKDRYGQHYIDSIQHKLENLQQMYVDKDICY